MLSFDAKEHKYSLAGVAVPSVTQVLQDCSLLPFYPDRQFYLNRGRAVHEACALLVKRQLDLGSTDPRLHGYIESFHKFMIRTGFHVKHIELPVWSLQYQFAGTLDYFGALNGSDTIVDLKSGDPADAAALQTAAYSFAAKESVGISAQRRLTLRLDPDGKECRPEEYSDLGNDIRIFLSATAVWHWRNQRNLIK